MSALLREDDPPVIRLTGVRRRVLLVEGGHCASSLHTHVLPLYEGSWPGWQERLASVSEFTNGVEQLQPNGAEAFLTGQRPAGQFNWERISEFRSSEQVQLPSMYLMIKSSHAAPLVRRIVPAISVFRSSAHCHLEMEEFHLVVWFAEQLNPPKRVMFKREYPRASVAWCCGLGGGGGYQECQ